MGADKVDVIVVGGGTAGCSFVSHLCAVSDLSVSLFEAGSSFSSHPSNLFTSMARSGVMDTSLTASAVANGDSYAYLQAQVLGGGSAVNGLIALRGAIDDFNEWCEYDALADWSWERVEPWFRAVGTPTSLIEESVPQSVARLMHDSWPGSLAVPLAVARNWRQSADGERFTAARESGRLSANTHAPVARVLFTGSRATAVELADGSRHEARNIVMCAGALRTPMLLRRSGVDAEGLGENLQDHPNVMFAARRRGPFIGDLPVTRYVPLKGDSDTDAPDVAHILSYEQIDTDAHLGGIGVSLMDVHSRGSLVELPDGGWKAEFRCLSDERDLQEMVRVVRDVSTVLASTNLGGAFDGEDALRLAADLQRIAAMTDRGITEWLQRHVRTLSHAAGTCAMGTVCDARGQVADIDGLWVADASLMPRIVRANTNETVAMMATRVAQFVADTLGG
ncbi:MAG: GMC family oxidoreductase [Actinomycetota bacterium]